MESEKKFRKINTHIQAIKRMLYNHGWEKQQTQRSKGSGRQKKTTKRYLATGQKDYFKCIQLDKNFINRNKNNNQENVQKEIIARISSNSTGRNELGMLPFR